MSKINPLQKPTSQANTQRLVVDMKERLERYGGERTAKMSQLKPGATDEEMRTKINELIALLQGE